MSFGKFKFASKFNPVWKWVAKRLASKCERCGQTRLESVFDAYITDNKPDCKGCSTAYHLTCPLIKPPMTKRVAKKLKRSGVKRVEIGLDGFKAYTCNGQVKKEGVTQKESVKKMSIREKEGQPKPIKDIKTDFKLSEYCPFCKLRRKLQNEIRKLIKGK